MTTLSLETQWIARLKLRAEGSKLWAEGDKLWAYPAPISEVREGRLGAGQVG